MENNVSDLRVLMYPILWLNITIDISIKHNEYKYLRYKSSLHFPNGIKCLFHGLELDMSKLCTLTFCQRIQFLDATSALLQLQ